MPSQVFKFHPVLRVAAIHVAPRMHLTCAANEDSWSVSKSRPSIDGMAPCITGGNLGTDMLTLGKSKMKDSKFQASNFQSLCSSTLRASNRLGSEGPDPYGGYTTHGFHVPWTSLGSEDPWGNGATGWFERQKWRKAPRNRS